MNRPAIAVTGLGMITPAGHTTDTTWDGICRGESFARTVPELHGCAVDFACTVTGIDLDGAVGGRTAFRMGRYVKFAVLAAREAVTDAGLDPAHWDGARVAVVVGTSSGGSAGLTEQAVALERRGPEATSPSGILLTIPSMPAAEIAIQMKATGPSLAPCTACSSGVTALSVARDMLALGQCDIAIAGATESIVFPVAMTGFARSGAAALRDGDPARLCRPFAADRAGLVMGEGAAIMVLERVDDARARGAVPRALLAGTGATTDAHHPTSPHPPGRSPRPPWTRHWPTRAGGPRTSTTSTRTGPRPPGATRRKPPSSAGPTRTGRPSPPPRASWATAWGRPVPSRRG